MRTAECGPSQKWYQLQAAGPCRVKSDLEAGAFSACIRATLLLGWVETAPSSRQGTELWFFEQKAQYLNTTYFG
jgi:hypothetical protein